MFSQTIENTFYKIQVPVNTSIKAFQSTHEALASIDSYQFIVNGKPKYIFYMMSNKLETEVIVGLENYKDFLFDIGDIDITKAEIFNDLIKVYYNYTDKKAIEGVIYIGIRGNILNRFLLMYPNQSSLKTFDEEVDLIVKDVDYRKTNWD